MDVINEVGGILYIQCECQDVLFYVAIVYFIFFSVVLNDITFEGYLASMVKIPL
jgi:hypothetical protein